MSFSKTSLVRAVASMYSWGGVGQKFPNDEENFRIFHGIRSHEGVCYPENEDAIYKQKYADIVYAKTYYRSMQYRRKLFFIGGGNEGRRPEEIFKFRFSEMPFPGLCGSFDRILMVRKRSSIKF